MIIQMGIGRRTYTLLISHSLYHPFPTSFGDTAHSSAHAECAQMHMGGHRFCYYIYIIQMLYYATPYSCILQRTHTHTHTTCKKYYIITNQAGFCLYGTCGNVHLLSTGLFAIKPIRIHLLNQMRTMPGLPVAAPPPRNGITHSPAAR